MSPLVSVIVPLYNRKALIRRCVESVLKQTFGDWELIIVDDGSTDAPEEVLASLQACDSRIRIIRQPNGGVSVARNTGLDAAQGEYIQFLDSDDELLPDALAYTTAEMQREQADVVAFHFTHNAICDKQTSPAGAAVFVHAPDFMYTLMQRNLLCGPVNKLWKRSVIAESRFCPSVSWGEDFIFNLRVLQKMRRGVYSSRGLYCVHADAPVSLSRSYAPNGFSDFLAQAQVVDSLLDVMPDHKLRRIFYVYLWACYMQCIKKLCVGSGLSFLKKLEILKSWDKHPRVAALLPTAGENRTWVSLLAQKHLMLPVPFVQQCVVRKSRLAAMLRRVKSDTRHG